MNTQYNNYFTKGFENQIENYVINNLNTTFKKQPYQGFVPIVASRIEEICKNWLKQLKEAAKQKKFCLEVRFNNEHLDENAIYLIQEIFTKKVQISVHLKLGLYTASDSTYDRPKFANFPNSLCPDVLLYTCTSHYLKCSWTPEVRKLYPKKKPPKAPVQQPSVVHRYTYDPEANGTLFLKLAQQAIETDFKLISETGDQIPIHSLFLKVKSEYFNGMLNANMQESQTKSVTLPHSTAALNNLVQFIYQGKLDSSSHQDFDLLLEMLEMANGYLLADLTNHCMDLIFQFLHQQKTLTAETIVKLIHVGCMHGMTDFLGFALKAAEKASSSQKDAIQQAFIIDWKKVHKEHYKALLDFAIKHSLPRMEQELTRLINS